MNAGRRIRPRLLDVRLNLRLAVCVFRTILSSPNLALQDNLDDIAHGLGVDEEQNNRI